MRRTIIVLGESAKGKEELTTAFKEKFPFIRRVDDENTIMMKGHSMSFNLIYFDFIELDEAVRNTGDLKTIQHLIAILNSQHTITTI